MQNNFMVFENSFRKSSVFAFPFPDPDAREFLIHPPLFLANLGHYRASRIDLSKPTKPKFTNPNF